MKKDEKEKIKQDFINYLRQNGKRPVSVYTFMQETESGEEKIFYTHFTNFIEIEREIWREFLEETLRRIYGEPIYEDYGSREKLLSFLYTLIEVLKENRSFIVVSGIKGDALKYFKEGFLAYIKNLLDTAVDNHEIKQRMFFSNKYPNFIWLEVEYILKFWEKDQSANFEQTDAAIEKAVNLTFDLLGTNLVDSTFDFVKFAFQNRKK